MRFYLLEHVGTLQQWSWLGWFILARSIPQQELRVVIVMIVILRSFTKNHRVEGIIKKSLYLTFYSELLKEAYLLFRSKWNYIICIYYNIVIINTPNIAHILILFYQFYSFLIFFYAFIFLNLVIIKFKFILAQIINYDSSFLLTYF